jgi:hypothetical protein
MEALDPWDDLPEHERGPRKTGKNLPASAPPEDQWPGRGEIDGADRHTYMTLRKHFREQAAARRDTCLFCHGFVTARSTSR